MSEKNPIPDAIRHLKSELAALDAQLDTRRAEAGDPDPTPDRSQELDELFRSRAGIFRSHKHADAHEWDPLVLKRRKAAILNLIPQAQERFAQKYPALSIPDLLMQFNAPAADVTFDTLNKEYDIELAAAIWILDYLKVNDLMDEAGQYLPRTREELDTVYLPNLTDAVHSDDELRSVICVIRHRSRGMSGYRDGVAFCDAADAGIKTEADEAPSKDREAFDAILSLIDGELVKGLQDTYCTHLWDAFDQLLSLTDRLTRELCEQKQALRKGLAAQLAVYEKAQIAQPSPLMVTGAQNPLKELLSDGSAIGEMLPEISKAEKEAEALRQEVKRCADRIESVFFLLPMAPKWFAGDLPGDGDMDVFADLQVPVIRNPYEVCFAFLSLLNENSDAVWLYNLSLNVAAFACQALPWADANVVDPDGDRGEIGVDYEYLRSLVEKMPDWSEDAATDQLYELCIPSPLLKAKRVRTSIARLTFLASGLIPPRTGDSILFTRALLNETVFPPAMQDMIYHYFALAYAVNHHAEDYQTPDDSRFADEAEEEKAKSEDQGEEIKKLRAQIKHLKSVVHQAEQQNKALSTELASTKHKLEASNAELAELRSMIREQGDGEEAPTVIAFPYTAQKRTVIIGGHDSWLKAIKPLLNNVRYIGPSEQPNPGVILNSEVVWIQTNAMGHSGFYKIIDIVRKNDIKVCYFKYASAEKCAEQLALEEAQEVPPAEE